MFLHSLFCIIPGMALIPKMAGSCIIIIDSPIQLINAFIGLHERTHFFNPNLLSSHPMHFVIT